MLGKMKAVAAMGVGAGLVLGAKKLATAPVPSDVAARADAAAYSGPWRHGYAEVNGVRLHYAEAGPEEAPLVILLHGFPECWYEWRLIIPRLMPYFRVVALDMRGYNWSGKPAGVGAYTLDKLSGDVEGLIASFGRERAHVVGHDWGGGVAWHFAATRPGWLDRLVVTNAPHPGAYRRELLRSSQWLRSYYIGLFQLPLLPEAMVRLMMRSTLRGSAYTPGAFSDETLDVYANALGQQGAATAMVNYYRAAARHPQHLLDGEAIITQPTMLVWGMKDFALAPQLTEGLEEWVPGIRVERVDDSGHWLPEEKPGLLGELLLDFLG